MMRSVLVKRAALAGAVLLLASCSSGPPPPAPMPPPATPTAPPAIALPPTAPVAEKDQCGLKDAQAFVGKKRTDLPAPVDPSRWRVACTTCPVTMDFRPDRLNILFNADTGVVQQVKCG